MVSAVLGIVLSHGIAHAQIGQLSYGGTQPWWNIFSQKNKSLTPEEERLNKFWHDYYDALKQYYSALDHIDWVAYYKNHGYQINPAATAAPTGDLATSLTIRSRSLPACSGRFPPLRPRWVVRPAGLMAVRPAGLMAVRAGTKQADRVRPPFCSPPYEGGEGGVNSAAPRIPPLRKRARRSGESPN